MPDIILSSHEMAKVRNQTGVYSQLRRKEVEKNTHSKISDAVEDCVKKAFMEWANKHKGATPEMVNKSWAQFQRILQRYL